MLLLSPFFRRLKYHVACQVFLLIACMYSLPCVIYYIRAAYLSPTFSPRPTMSRPALLSTLAERSSLQRRCTDENIKGCTTPMRCAAGVPASRLHYPLNVNWICEYGSEQTGQQESARIHVIGGGNFGYEHRILNLHACVQVVFGPIRQCLRLAVAATDVQHPFQRLDTWIFLKWLPCGCFTFRPRTGPERQVSTVYEPSRPDAEQPPG